MPSSLLIERLGCWCDKRQSSWIDGFFVLWVTLFVNICPSLNLLMLKFVKHQRESWRCLTRWCRSGSEKWYLQKSCIKGGLDSGTPIPKLVSVPTVEKYKHESLNTLGTYSISLFIDRDFRGNLVLIKILLDLVSDGGVFHVLYGAFLLIGGILSL